MPARPVTAPPFARTNAPRVPGLLRTPLRKLTVMRFLRGGRIDDGGRLPRYVGLFLLGAAAIWAPITGYLGTAPERFTSEMSLILPGSGASASVNLSDIGQASSNASSPFSSSSVSPTVTYKRLIGADRILDGAAGAMGIGRHEFGAPRVELIDQTSLIRVRMVGNSPRDAQARGDALIAAFFQELDALRTDELDVRETGGEGAIGEFRDSVARTRIEIDRLQRDTGLISAAQYQELVAETGALARRLGQMRDSLSEQAESARALQAALGVTPAIAAATLKLHADTEFTALIDETSRQAAALAEAQGRFGPRHPTVLDARAAHAGTRDTALRRAGAITGLGAGDLARLDLAPIGGRADLLARLVELDTRRKGLQAEVAAIARRLARDEARVSALLEPSARLEDLQRDFQVAEAVFASAMARSKTSKSDIYASYPLVQVLENPSLPSAPSSPRKTLAIAAGGAATVMLLVGLTLGWLRRPLIDRLIAAPAAA